MLGGKERELRKGVGAGRKVRVLSGTWSKAREAGRKRRGGRVGWEERTGRGKGLGGKEGYVAQSGFNQLWQSREDGRPTIAERSEQFYIKMLLTEQLRHTSTFSPISNQCD